MEVKLKTRKATSSAKVVEFLVVQKLLDFKPVIPIEKNQRCAVSLQVCVSSKWGVLLVRFCNHGSKQQTPTHSSTDSMPRRRSCSTLPSIEKAYKGERQLVNT